MNENNKTSSINGEINSDFIPSNKKVIYIPSSFLKLFNGK